MRAVGIVIVSLLAGCGSKPALDYGREQFSDRTVSTADSNAFSCATCHDVSAAPTGLRPGYTLYDSVGRPSYWAGFVLTLREAMNQCITSFMRGKELAEDDDKGRALFVYLQSISPSASSPARPYTVVPDIKDIASGDAGRGGAIYDDACARCHGRPHTGDGRISEKQSIIPDDTLRMFGVDPKTGTRPITIEKVRHGKFFNVGGDMPPYSLEALSDAQLADVLAFLEGFGLPKSQ